MPEIPVVHVITLALAIVLLWSLSLNVRLWWTGRRKLRDAAGMLQGARVDRGLIAEQFAPFTKKFDELGWDPQEFKFLGRPVDGVQFQDDEVIIVEFKTGASQLTSRQRNIKKLIAEGKVRFEEIRF
jgi:predicted Holliday junction resolvase-like endonuclease